MLVREYTEADLDALRRMHARQGFDYAFPDLADPIFVSKLVVEDDDGRTVMASLARLTCEMYLVVDHADGGASGPARGSPLGTGGAENRRHDSSGPRERYAQLLALHRAGERDLLARGLDDAHAWLPPPIARRFGRRLESLGWIRDDAWTPYCRRLRDRS
ncbi:MAG: hypothetical protein ABR973_05200 [Candidatus Acidiferrales bacterium]